MPAWLCPAVGGPAIEGPGRAVDDAGPAPVTCDATEDDVLASTADAEAEAGAVLLCTPPSDLAATSLQEDAAFHGYEGPTLEVDARRWVFSFATPRADGDPALSSARLFLPAAEPEAPLPLVVLAHPTTGLGDVCAPTRMDARDPSNQDTARLLNPLVGTGWEAMGWKPGALPGRSLTTG